MQDQVDYSTVINQIFQKVSADENSGAVADYIPDLAKIDPDKFGVCMRTIGKEEFGVGDYQTKFSIQSIAKVLSLSLAYSKLGDRIWERVGVEPSGTAFNSLLQLEKDNGIPRNPLINAGAIVICDILLSHSKNAPAELLEFVQNICGNVDIRYSESIAESEKSVGYRNIALCNYIKSLGNIQNDPNEVLDFYFKKCSIELTCQELTRTFMYLVENDYQTPDQNQVLNFKQTKRINAIMQTCGFYDEAGEFAFKVGLPGKSGVGGGIIAIHPGQYSIALWSPRLNSHGNSVRGMQFLEAFTTQTHSTIF